MQDHDVSELMYAETENAPPPRIDVAQTMRDGRRQRQWRRSGPALAAVAVLAVVAGITVVHIGPAAPSKRDVSAPNATKATTGALAPAAFDPLRLRLSAGWVPAGLNRQDPVMATGTQRIVWSEPVAVMQTPQRWVDVTIYAADIEPWQITFMHPAKEATDPVNGAQAVWLIPKSHQPDALAWRWAPNAWAVAVVHETDESTQRAVARRVAESVRTDANDPVLLPFTLKRPPAPLQLTMIEPDGRPPQYSVTLRFGLDGKPVTWFYGTNDQSVADVIVTWVPAGYQNKDKPNRTLDGSKAAVHFQSQDWGSITLYRDGYEVSLGLPTRDVRQYIDEKTAIAIVTSVTLVGTPTDRTHWTADPLR